MLTLKRLLILLAIATLALMASACVANPTPHPGSGDNTGLNSEGGTSLGTSANSETPPTAATDEAAREGDGEMDNVAGGSEPNAGPQDASVETDVMQGDASTDDDADVDPVSDDDGDIGPVSDDDAEPVDDDAEPVDDDAEPVDDDAGPESD